jgi:excisionase family DNA binding protein
VSAKPSQPTPVLSDGPQTPALALTVEQAAAALSVGYDVFHRSIEPELRIVRIGRRKLIPVSELQRYLDDHAERTL